MEEEGHELLLIDDLSRGKEEYLNWLEVETPLKIQDLRDYDADLLNEIDTVFHCACRIGGEQFLHGSHLKEITALQDNLAIDRNVFKSCIVNQVKKVIYTSSISVYNTKKQYETNNAIFKEEDLENDPIDPEGGYGWAKYLAEQQLWYMSQMDIKTSSLRIFKSYGPCDDYSPESGQVVCSLMRKAINYPEEDFEVWGDGSAKRCLLYIDDLIDAMMRVYGMKHPLNFNIGATKPTSIKQLANKIVKLSSKEIDIKWDESKKGGPKSRIPDLSRIETHTGWKPTTTLGKGLEVCWNWMEQQKCL